MAGVAHFTEAGHEEVVAPMVGRGVLLYVGKLHKLPGRREGCRGGVTTVLPAFELWDLVAPGPCCRTARGQPHPGSHASQTRLPQHTEFQILLTAPDYTIGLGEPGMGAKTK